MRVPTIAFLALALTGCMTPERKAIQIESRSFAFCFGRGYDLDTTAHTSCMNNAAPHFTKVVEAPSEYEKQQALGALVD